MTTLLLVNDKQMQLENVQFAFRTNFAGRQEKYNREGDRYFNIKIDDPETADMLIDMGFNIKKYDPFERAAKRGEELEMSEDQVDIFWFMKVPVYTMYAPPTICVIDTSEIPELDEVVEPDRKTFLPVELFESIDTMQTSNVDVILAVRPPAADNGIYNRVSLKTMYISVEMSPLERKYS